MKKTKKNMEICSKIESKNDFKSSPQEISLKGDRQPLF